MFAYDLFEVTLVVSLYQPPHDKTNKMTFAPSEDLAQSEYYPSLIRVITVRLVGNLGPKLSSGGQRRLSSDWADAQIILFVL